MTDHELLFGRREADCPYTDAHAVLDELAPAFAVWAWCVAAALIVGALLFAPRDAQAAPDLHIVLHGVSKHARSLNDQGDPYNETNEGLGIRVGDERRAFQFSYLRNSFDAWSPYLGAEYLPFKAFGGRVGVMVGATKNYPTIRDGGWTPFAGLIVRWEIGGVAAPVLRGVPPLGKTHGALAAEIGFHVTTF